MKKDLKSELNWDVCVESIKLNNTIDSGKRAIVRSDTKQLLGIVGKNYRPISNTQLMEFTNTLTQSGEFELKGFDEVNDGKIVLAFLKNTNPNLKINGCTNEEYMFIGNSFDGTKPFHIGTASNLVRCANQFTSTLKVFNKKHTSFINLNQNIAQEIIAKYKLKKSNLYETFDGMESIKVDESIINRLIKEIYTMLNQDSKKDKSKDWTNSPSMQLLHQSIVKETKDLGNNAFGLFNGVTWYTTHEMRTVDVINSQINGTANLINQKAFRFCNQLKRASTELHELL